MAQSAHFKFMVIAYGRSGTTYASKLFGHLGYDVGHERIAKDGYCGYQFAWPEGHPSLIAADTLRSEATADHIIHLVRDPWLVLNSNLAGGRGFSDIVDCVLTLEGNLCEREMRAIMEWHHAAQRQEPEITLRAERLWLTLPVWLESKGYEVKRDGAAPSRLTNAWKAHPEGGEFITQRVMDSVNAPLLLEFMTFAANIGYPLDDVVRAYGLQP